MRLLSLILGILLALVLLTRTEASESAETMLAQALELLQKGEKAKALKLLERTFEKAQDPEQVKEAAVLILSAAPESYSKREAYLRYLTQRYRTHEDVWKWHKELGDRAFEKGDFNQAEEAYLNAQTQAPDPFLIKYKLAWVYWNQNRRNEALSIILDLCAKANGDDPDALSLRHQMTKEVAHLWWELGPMPEATYAKLLILESDIRTAIFSEVIESFPVDQMPKPHSIEMLKQIRDNELSRSAFNEVLTRDLYFKKAPCFMIANILGPTDFASKHALVSCAKDPQHPPFEELERHFVHNLPTADENLLRAYASLLQEAGQNSKAALVLLQWNDFSTADAGYLKGLYSLLLVLSNEDLASLYSTVPQDRWEKILSSTKDTALLVRLTELDPQRWIAYEESLYAGKPLPRALQLRKLRLLAQNYIGNRSEIESTVRSLIEKPANAEEKALKKILSNVEKTSSTELSETFDEKFTKDLYRWITSLDKNISEYQKLSDDWKSLVAPLVQDQLQANLNQLRAQIDEANLPEGSAESESDFLTRKAELRDQLLQKYTTAFAPPL